MPPAVLATVIACLSAEPATCERFPLDYVRPDGATPTLMDCMTSGGQVMARLWLLDHPDWVLRRIECSYATGSPARLRDQIVGPRA